MRIRLGSEGRPQRKLPGARRGPREHEDAHVPAREHEQEQREGLADRDADAGLGRVDAGERVRVRQHLRLEPGVHCREPVGHALPGEVDLVLRLLERDAVGQPADDPSPRARGWIAATRLDAGEHTRTLLV